MTSLSLVLMLSLTGATEGYLGAPVVSGSVQLDEPGRYRSPRNYDSTVEYYRRYFKSRGGIRWRHIINSPSIKAKHIQNVRSKDKWVGINIYEKQGKVRIFIVPRHPSPKKKSP